MPILSEMRKFTTSHSFPRLARLEIRDMRISPQDVELLARGPWPLRHLKLSDCDVRKAGAEALANAKFAESLRVLELPECNITAGGIQALAGSAKLAGLKHLNLYSNPVGIGGLAAIARSEHLRELRSLTLASCNHAKAPIDSTSMMNFLTALDMPELRHLALDWLPVGVRGARAIGAGGSFANLTRLGLTSCALHEKGVRAIVESDSLSNLTHLALADNAAKKGVTKLSDPKVLPRLGWVNVATNRIPSGTLSRIRKRPGVRV
jgi:hypothetical protein